MSVCFINFNGCWRLRIIFFLSCFFFESFSEKNLSLSFSWFIRRHRHCCFFFASFPPFYFPSYWLSFLFKIQEFGKSKKRKDSLRPDTNKLRARTQLFSVTTKRILYLQCDYYFYFKFFFVFHISKAEPTIFWMKLYIKVTEAF